MTSILSGAVALVFLAILFMLNPLLFVGLSLVILGLVAWLRRRAAGSAS